MNSSENNIPKGSQGTFHRLRLSILAGSLQQGGAERQLFYMATCLKNCGINLQVLSLTKGQFWELALLKSGIRTRFVGMSKLKVGRLIAIAKAVKLFRPTVVQSQHFFTNGYAAIAARLQGACALGAVRNDAFSDLADCGRLFGTACLRLPHFLVANSRRAIRNLTGLGCASSRIQYLPNVVDLNEFSRMPDRKSDSPIHILGVGRLVTQKRFDRFLRVLSLLQRRSAVSFRAIIVGTGPLMPALKEQLRNSGLTSDAVHFVGNVSRMATLYSKADLLLLTSDHEGTPNVVMEAMACGLPAISTKVGDVEDLLKHGETGFLLQPEDEEGIADCLLRLADQPELRRRIGQRAREYIAAHHDIKFLPNHLEELYYQTASTGTSSSDSKRLTTGAIYGS